MSQRREDSEVEIGLKFVPWMAKTNEIFRNKKHAGSANEIILALQGIAMQLHRYLPSIQELIMLLHVGLGLISLSHARNDCGQVADRNSEWHIYGRHHDGK